MDLTFNTDEVRKLLEHARQATMRRAEPYSGEPNSADNAPALWLVGDRGVYLMSNGVTEGLPRVVYANECNPDKGDDWYDIKRATFGGDDGAEHLDGELIQRWLDTAIRKTVAIRFKGNKIEFR